MKKSIVLTASLFAGLSSLEAQKIQKPNIILIMTDQQRWDATGITNPVVHTPNLNRLAGEGIWFDHGYTTTPSSTPARAALLTGMSPWSHGMLGYGRVARNYPVELPALLRAAGYYTFGIGKMHWFPQKALHGFHGTLVDESGRIEQDGYISDYRNWFKLQAPGLNPDSLGIGWNDHSAGTYPLEERLHPTCWTGETAVEFIKNYKDPRPLFLKVSFARPHSPYDPPQRFTDLYANADIPAPVAGDWADSFAAPSRAKDAAFGDYGTAYAQNSRKHYYASISFIDEQIGHIIEALKAQGLYENSLICFVSDHGDMLGDHYHWRKTYAYEGSTHIPFLIRWPEQMEVKASRGSHLPQVVELRDILPTFAEAAGEKIPETVEGSSLLTLLKNPQAEWREYIDLEHATCYSRENYWCALTDGKIKYIWFYTTGEEQLFDLRKDPMECQNLSHNKKYARTLEQWRERMVKHLGIRGEEFVKAGELQKRTSTLLYSPNYPQDKRQASQKLKSWIQESHF